MIEWGVSDKISFYNGASVKNGEDDNGWNSDKLSLQHFSNCVPSQINYVISTRFNPEHGFVVESRRGGGVI